MTDAARLRDLRRALEALGVSVTEPSKGSHWKAAKDGKVYPIPAHNGPKTEMVMSTCEACVAPSD